MKKLVLFIALCIAYIGADAQNIREYIKTSPAELFVSVDSVGRAKMYDSMLQGAAPSAFTIFGDTIKINTVNDNFASFSYSGTDVQVRNVGDMLVVAKTYGAESRESELYFYDYDWQLKSSWIYGTKKSEMMPCDEAVLSVLVIKPDTMSASDFEDLKLFFDPMFVVAELSESTNELTLKPVCPLLSKEEKERLQPVLKQKTFKWTNKTFK